jgi:hypothetical protein
MYNIKQIMTESNIDIPPTIININNPAKSDFSDTISNDTNITGNSKDSKSSINVASSEYKKTVIGLLRTQFTIDIQEMFKWRKIWMRIACIAYSLAEIFGIVQTILSFTSSARPSDWLISFLGGMFGLLAITISRFGTYSNSKSSEKTSQANEILKALNMKDSIPDLTDGPDMEKAKEKKG